MTTATRHSDLQVLGRVLQERLNSQLATERTIEVKCVLQGDTLMVLAQEASLASERAESIFNVLQDSIEAIQPSLTDSVWEQTERVRLYLRVTGQRQPFAVRDFTLTKSNLSAPFSSVDSKPESSLESNNFNHNVFRWDEENQPTDDSNSSDRKNFDSPEELPSEAIASESPFISDSIEDLALEEPSNEADSEQDFPLGSQNNSAPLKNQQRNAALPTLLKVGAGVAIISAIGGFYAVTRPCVVGECTAIENAQQLRNESINTLKTAKTESEIQQSRAKLTKATRELNDIPFWSSHHGDAQKLIKSYRIEAQTIDPLISGLNAAKLASENSQNPPHSIQKWEEIQSNWRQAIAQVQQVPQNSPVYTLSQQKLKTYQSNLATINQRLKQEQEAETKFALAKQTAKLGQVRQDAAKTLSHWQQVQSTWEAAINSLSSIPKNTVAYEEAQLLLASYQPNLATVRDRVNQEDIAAKIYNQAITIASLAKSFEQQNQWTQAVTSWRRASTYAQQVPSGTYYHAQAQQLSDSYSASLSKAQAKLQVALILQKARTDLDRICTGVPKICNHTVDRQTIKVYLTPAYVNGVRRTAMTAGLSGDATTLAGVDDHLKTLQVALEAISENADVTLEIYDQNRALIGRYVPQPTTNP